MALNKYSSRITQPKSQGASQAMLYGTGLTREDMDKPQVGIASVWYEGNTCNMHLNDLAAKVKEGVSGSRHGRHAVQHHRRQRRHLDGHRGHELLAAIARPDRRLDRNGDGRPVVRRQHLDPGLRQEHAGLPDRHGPAQPPVADGLRRHDQAGPSHARRRGRKARHRLGLSVLRRVPGRHDRRRGARRKSSPRPAPAPAPAAACTRPTPWPRPSKRWACRCPTARRFRRTIRPSSTNACGPARRFASAWSGTSSPATS